MMFGRKNRKIKLLSRHLDVWIDTCREAEDRNDTLRQLRAERGKEIKQLKRSVDLWSSLYVDSKDRAEHLTERVREQSEQIRELKHTLAARNGTLWSFRRKLFNRNQQIHDLKFTLSVLADLIRHTWTRFIEDESTLADSLVYLRNIARKAARR